MIHFLIVLGTITASFGVSVMVSSRLHRSVARQRVTIQAMSADRVERLEQQRRRYQSYLQGDIGWSEVDASPSPTEVSKNLLMEHLTPKQRQEYAAHNQFTVKGSDGRAYTIACHRDSYNVCDGKFFYCTHAHSNFSVPLWDELLAQKLLIQTDINAFMKVANKRAAL